VVIAASNGTELLRESLLALTEQAVAVGAEVIVARNFDADGGALLKRDFPFVVDLALDPSTTVPSLRAAGIRQSTGAIVALLEDHCTTAPGWCGAILAEHATARSVVAGPVAQALDGTPVDWAVYFYDYGRFMPGAPKPPGAFSGNNVSFPREVIDALASHWQDGVFEAVLPEVLRRHSVPVRMAEDAIVVHRKHYRLGRAVRNAWHLGRGYAAQRVASGSSSRRAGFALGALVLPVLLPLRAFARTVAARRHLGRLARALPYLVLIFWSWSAGEFMGYSLGPGRSPGEWR
jgi:hypothetical protein